MSVFNLTTANPESEELEYIEGVIQALVDNTSTFGGASVLLAVSIDGSEFVPATTDDFSISSADSLRFVLNNGSTYKYILSPVGVGADITVYSTVDPNACWGGL